MFVLFQENKRIVNMFNTFLIFSKNYLSSVFTILHNFYNFTIFTALQLF